MPIESISALVADEFEQLKKTVIENISANVGLVERLSNHILKSGGKQLRPLLLMLTAKACGYQGNQQVLPAAAIEYFHTATLLHDDVLDESTMRRGQQTANTIWGDKASILVGDILLTQSVQFMTKTDSMPMLKVLINAAHEITCGEVKQLANANQTYLAIEEYFDVIRAKTALLFSAAAEIGALISDMPTATVDSMRQYGLHLGNAFQIVDDILDYAANAETTGKRIGDDLRDGKITLPLIFVLQQATDEEKKLIEQALVNDADPHLEQIIELMHHYQAFEQSKQVARTEIDSALNCLNCLPDNQYRQALIELANFTISRTY